MGFLAMVAFVLVTAVPAYAQNDDVAATKHNLSASSGGGAPTGATVVDYGEICVYCHTPHGGLNDAPLWNRNFSSATYDMYDNAKSSTIDMTVNAQPTGISMACLSCHDGTIGLDVIVNAPNTYGGSIPGTTPGTNTMPAGVTNLGTDLRNDHPISVVYDPALDTAFQPEASILSAGLKLFVDPTTTGNKVQCASCHNPHDNTNEPFLRIANTSSNLCTTCHIK
ncbi:MAG: cytochrome c3 family protein [Rhodothermales bacterium]